MTTSRNAMKYDYWCCLFAFPCPLVETYAKNFLKSVRILNMQCAAMSALSSINNGP
jgi:hypothetical protein